MKKILLSCACCLLALGLVTACDDEVKDDGGEEEGETTYLFGVEIDGVLSYATGATQTEGTYRGVLSTSVSEAVVVSYEQEGSAYYLSFDNSGVTNWITIISGDYTNLSYATEKSPIYLHTTDGGAEYFGNEDGSYFLCYNATYDCLYASTVSSWLASSPVAGLYTTDGKLVLGGKGGTTTSSGTTTEHGTPAPTLEATEVPEGAYGIFDFSQLEITEASKAWTTDKEVDGETYLAEAWKPADNTTTLPCTITSTTFTYAGAGGNSSQNDAYQLSLQCIKLSRSKTSNSEYEGTLVLDFGSTTISKIEVAALDWNSSEGATLAVAAPDAISSATAQDITGDASDASAEIATYTFDNLSSSSIELYATARVLVFSIVVYTAA